MHVFKPDTVVIECIFRSATLSNISSLLMVNKQFNKVGTQYLYNNCWKQDWLEKTTKQLDKEYKEYTYQRAKINSSQYNILALSRKLSMFQQFNGEKPDGMMRNESIKKWLHVPVSYIIKHSAYYEIIYVKTGLNHTKFNQILHKFKEFGFHRCILKPQERNPKYQISMVFTTDLIRTFRKVLECPICKNQHLYHKCPDIVCNLCKKKGHIPRYCMQAYCWICDASGHLPKLHEQDQSNYFEEN